MRSRSPSVGCGEGIYNGRAYEWKFRSEKNRRSAFTLEQYTTLHRYMRTNTFLYRANIGQTNALSDIERCCAYILFWRIQDCALVKRDICGGLTYQSEQTNSVVVCWLCASRQSKVRKATARMAVIGRFARALERWKAYLDESGEGWAKTVTSFATQQARQFSGRVQLGHSRGRRGV